MGKSRAQTFDFGAGAALKPRALSIAHIVLSLELGGLERLALDLVREHQVSGQRTGVICLERPGRLAAEAEALGTRVVCVDKRPGIRPETFGRLRNAIAELQPDVVHTHQVGALFYSGPVAGVPIVHTEHGKAGDDIPRRRWLGRLAGCFATRYCCVSKDIADELLERRIVPARKIMVVPNGIDLSRFRGRTTRADCRASLGIPAGVPVVGTVGRLDEVKRQDVLIRAFGRLLGHVSEAHLLIVGDGPQGAELRQLAESLDIAGRVHFTGYQPRPEEFLAAMDVFGLSSRSEGMPLAVLEAWAAGLPVVATRVGGLPELIDDGRSGVLVDNGNEAAFAQALANLIVEPTVALELGECGRRRVEADYSLSRMIQTYERIYVDLAHTDRTSAPTRLAYRRTRSGLGDLGS
ncbi:glycosyltransferase [Paludisphaera rhizosphaerae]|uniref:glycosyltransferase n=1 Tax=Paludisphaera rhizosphaerae TaxID=2711216 RepID=UPI0013ECBF1D|nr:glycosyltransferase [Paludisphaera rhizosphaerae]